MSADVEANSAKPWCEPAELAREAERSKGDTTADLANLGRIDDFSITRSRMPYDRVYRNLLCVALAQVASFFLELVTRVPRNVHLVLTPTKAP